MRGVVGEHFNAIAATVASHAWKRPKKRSSSSQGIGLAQHGPILEHIVHADGAIPVEVTDLDRASERLLRTLAGDDLDGLLDRDARKSYLVYREDDNDLRVELEYHSSCSGKGAFSRRHALAEREAVNLLRTRDLKSKLRKAGSLARRGRNF